MIKAKEGESQEFLDFCENNKGKYIEVIYNPGYADYTGKYKELENNEFQRVFKIGLSTGNEPVLLEISGKDSLGGPQLFAHENALKSWRKAKLNDVEEISEISECLNGSLKDWLMKFYTEDGLNEEEFLKESLKLVDFAI